MKSRASAFKKRIYDYYKKNGRHSLPWRKTTNPYRILVSEVMLQQTQVDRVIPKYKQFLKKFPTVQKLANANLSEVLQLWSGLGYNRRARMLHEAAKRIVEKHQGRFPRSLVDLEALPGVGPYTARAITTFAHNQPVVMIETNIRTVFLHEFFREQSNVPDSEVLRLTKHFLDEDNPREWYAALMDYGSYLKRAYPNPSRKSKHHTTQSKFKGSLREVRGKVLRALLKEGKTVQRLVKETGGGKSYVEEAIKGLRDDALVEKRGQKWELAT